MGSLENGFSDILLTFQEFICLTVGDNSGSLPVLERQIPNPIASMMAIQNPALEGIAGEVTNKLQKVISHL